MKVLLQQKFLCYSSFSRNGGVVYHPLVLQMESYYNKIGRMKLDYSAGR